MKAILRVVVVSAAVGLATLGMATSAFAATGSGSVSVALTQPRAVSGTASAAVTCTTNGTVYTVRTQRVTIHGATISAAAVIHGYAGPGTYKAAVALTYVHAGVTTAGAVRYVPLTISETGGTWTFARTATGAKYPKIAGVTFAGTISYTCG
jgi:hypothetical protein